jgi:hypothetical protein
MLNWQTLRVKVLTSKNSIVRIESGRLIYQVVKKLRSGRNRCGVTRNLENKPLLN